jgi:hypothetical protein
MVNTRELLWRLEREFWTRGASFYRENLSTNCSMILPGVGILSRASVIEAISKAERWTTVEMEHTMETTIGSDVVVLSYAAKGERAGQPTPYYVWVGSTYAFDDDRWRLTFHQQTLREASP